MADLQTIKIRDLIETQQVLTTDYMILEKDTGTFKCQARYLKGATGITPNITIGNTSTLAPGNLATVTKRGNTENPIFDFGIPQGVQGPIGPIGPKGDTPSIAPLQTEIDNRFNALTSQQQGSSEVIEARGGYPALKARLDAINDDLIKYNDQTIVTHTTESNFSSIDATKNGYLDNVLLEGKTLVVDSNNNVVIPGTQGATLKSVGDGITEIKLNSTRINIYDINTMDFTEIGSVKWKINKNIMTATSSVRYEVDKFIHIKLGKGLNYNISVKNINADIIIYDGNVTSHIQNKVITALSNSVKERTFISLSDSITIRATNGDRIGSNIIEELQLSAGNSKKTFEEYKVNSKKVLYKDTDGTWKKPTLRQWDSIEKHSDGKYYYHKRSDIYTVNGSSIILDANSGIQVTGYYTVRITIPGMVKTLGINTIISDKFKADIDVQEATEGIYNKNSYNGYNTIGLRLLNSKGSSLQEVKNYITNNPFNVIFKTDIEQVFECTPIDLISYETQTNYSIDCGPIYPKTTLKVNSYLGNVVSILKDKVSYLENMLVDGLKLVVAGNMQELAYQLYPQDFVSNVDDTVDMEVIK